MQSYILYELATEKIVYKSCLNYSQSLSYVEKEKLKHLLRTSNIANWRFNTFKDLYSQTSICSSLLLYLSPLFSISLLVFAHQ